ncbi:MAG: ABC transporter permease [Nitriliruptoraceae bacterium]
MGANDRVPSAWRRPFQAAVGLLADIARRPTGLVALIIMAGLLVAVTVGPLLVGDPAGQDIPRRLEGPSADYLLGTDHLGRDLLARLVNGARIAIGVAVPSVLIAMLIGLLLGLAAGYVGGRIDNAVVVLTDTIQAFPAIVLGVAILALLGPSMVNVIIVIALGFAPGYARVVRASVFAIKEDAFVQAERSLGSSTPRVLVLHILPNVIAPMLILMAIDLPVAVTIEAGLSFIGVGVPPPIPSWGVILNDGFDRIREAPWPVIWAALTLMITTLGFTLFGEALRDRLDPRVREAAGRGSARVQS